MKNRFKYILIILFYIVIVLPTSVKANTISFENRITTIGIGSPGTILEYTLADTKNNYIINWKSSNQKIATVKNGVVTGISEGTVTITATINGKSSTCRVVVSSNYISATKIDLDKTNLTMVIDSTEKLTPTISPSNAENKKVKWYSSNSEVATISGTGQITAKKVGKTTITVRTNNGLQTTCRVTVVDKISLQSININKQNIVIKEKSSDVLTISYTPSNATNKDITWKSSDTNIVTVNSSGKITGIKPGTATIKAISNDGGYVSICKVTVEAISKKVTSVSLNKKEINLIAGTEETLKATIKPDYAENKKIIWKSSNETVATVENGIVKAITPGTAEIKVTTEDGEKEDKCIITVKAPPVEKIVFSESKKEVYISSETELKIIKEPINSVFENAIWESSNEEIATVENGIVKAKNIGQTTITVSNEDKTIIASIEIIVIEKPKEKIKIEIEGYNFNFDPTIKNYELKIGKEDKLRITTSDENVIINGNQNLKDGSIVTITFEGDEIITYVIKIKKKENYSIYFIAIISVLLLINLIRIGIKNKEN